MFKYFTVNAVIALLAATLLLLSCNTKHGNTESDSVAEQRISMTIPVLFGMEIPESEISLNHIKGGSSRPELAKLVFRFTNLPEKEEAESFTLIGGGLNGTGFHGPNATGFEGKGYHFAIPAGTEGENPARDENYKMDFTRTVSGGILEFTVYYQPTNINEWGERYFPGCELALNLMRAGTGERVLHASNNEFNWAIAGIGEGNLGEIEIRLNHDRD